MLNPFKKTRSSSTPAVSSPKPGRTTAKPVEYPATAQARDAGVDAKARRFIGVVISPHLTEKASSGARLGWYAFRVKDGADKVAVRRAVEERYGVSVRGVRIIQKRSKTVRIGRTRGRTPGFKKAMVKIGEGQSIEFT